MDEYGFERPENFDYGMYEEFMSVYLRVLAKRAKKWSDMLSDGKSLKRNLTVKRYVRKGIPSMNIFRLLFTFIYYLDLDFIYALTSRWTS